MSETMRAVVLSEPNILQVQEVPVPEPSPGEALIAVELCGVCGSDVGITYGGAHVYPLILGHEFSGYVTAVGNRADSAWLGKLVTAYPISGCGHCACCAVGDYTKCPSYRFLGSRNDGAYAEYVKVPVDNLIDLGVPGINADAGALIEPLAVAVHAVRRLQRQRLSHSIVVGAGPIGLLTAQACRALGSGQVTVLDIDDSKVELAKRMGFSQSYNCRATPCEDILSAVWIKSGASAVFECSGTSAGLVDCLAYAAPGAGVVMVGIHKNDVALAPAHTRAIMKKELLLTGAWVSNYHKAQAENDWSIAASLIASGKVSVSSLITGREPLSRAPQVLQDIHDHPADHIKTLLICND